jgi:hypothetical protein
MKTDRLALLTGSLDHLKRRLGRLENRERAGVATWDDSAEVLELRQRIADAEYDERERRRVADRAVREVHDG